MECCPMDAYTGNVLHYIEGMGKLNTCTNANGQISMLHTTRTACLTSDSTGKRIGDILLCPRLSNNGSLSAQALNDQSAEALPLGSVAFLRAPNHWQEQTTSDSGPRGGGGITLRCYSTQFFYITYSPWASTRGDSTDIQPENGDEDAAAAGAAAAVAASGTTTMREK